MVKKKQTQKSHKKENFSFEKIAPLNQLFPRKLLRDKLRDLQHNPLVKNIGTTMRSGMKIMGHQAKRFGETAKDFAVQTQMQVKIAHYHSMINKLYMSIGEEVYEESKNQQKIPEEKSNVPRYINEINKIETEISELEKNKQ